ncbi:hypothetical protein [Actinopolyspora halophila]|uniref:hypothetical protein n=1 Tax=Actinopolyspora halophila TaxID=1850 RepID=UPI00039A199A|nr:hypothetical protein [Actinopolyspora halophila]
MGRTGIRAACSALLMTLGVLAASLGSPAYGQEQGDVDGSVRAKMSVQAQNYVGTSFDDRLIPGQYIGSGPYTLAMQRDGNLLLFDHSANRICWASGTNGTEQVYAKYSGDFVLGAPYMTLESPYGELRKYEGNYTGLHKTGDISINSSGEVWIAYEPFVSC